MADQHKEVPVYTPEQMIETAVRLFNDPAIKATDCHLRKVDDGTGQHCTVIMALTPNIRRFSDEFENNGRWYNDGECYNQK